MCNKMTCAPREDSDSLGIRPVWSVFTVCSIVVKGPMFLHADNEDWSDWVDAQADLSLCWAHVILLVLSYSGSNVYYIYHLQGSSNK